MRLKNLEVNLPILWFSKTPLLPDWVISCKCPLDKCAMSANVEKRMPTAKPTSEYRTKDIIWHVCFVRWPLRTGFHWTPSYHELLFTEAVSNKMLEKSSRCMGRDPLFRRHYSRMSSSVCGTKSMYGVSLPHFMYRMQIAPDELSSMPIRQGMWFANSCVSHHRTENMQNTKTCTPKSFLKPIRVKTPSCAHRPMCDRVLRVVLSVSLSSIV